MNSTVNGENWSLEVVRGKDVGHRFALRSGTLLLGNALNGSAGIDLGPQEGNAPRKMAGRQSQLDIAAGSIRIRDLDSPGGTFVNRQRVLAGQEKTLADGDVIQLGGVQLRLVKSAPAKVQPSTAKVPDHSGPLEFSFGSGLTCRSWDEFLVISAQRWAELREEVTSGRLAAYLHKIGRGDMAPDPNAYGSPDERLDAWIGRLPTTRPAQPELEVHPRTLTIPLASGAGTRRKLQISNTGFRLLKTTVRTETPNVAWLKIVSADKGEKTFVTLDSTEVTIEVTAPDSFAKPLTSSLAFEGNGGKVTVSIRLEPASKTDTIVPSSSRPVGSRSLGIRPWIARQSAVFRLAWWPATAALFRLAIDLLEKIPPAAGIPRVSETHPDLLGPTIGFSLIGAVTGLILGSRFGEPRDVPATGFTGAILGLLVSAVGVALCRVSDSLLPSIISGSSVAKILVMAALGALFAAVSIVVVPPSSAKESST